MNRPSKIAMLLVALVMGACTTATDTTTTTAPATTVSVDATTTSTQVTGSTEEPETDSDWTIDDHLAWLVGVLNGTQVTSDAYASRFAQVFTDQVSYEDFPSIIDQVTAGLSGWAVIDTESRGSTNLVVLIAPTGGEPILRVLLNMDAEQRIDGLFFQPGEPPTLDDVPESYDEAFGRLAALGDAGVLVAETTDGTCVPVAETMQQVPLALGSAFKIYVLGAVADAIAVGEIGWNDPVTLTEGSYSLPSGITQNAEPGSTLTVQLLAQRMIEISDNTATDHLIDLVDRSAVEMIQSDMGHSNPMLNTPFLQTRELFQLKLGDGSALDTFVGGDVETRRQVLQELATAPLPTLSAAVAWSDPVAVTTVEWFASPLDLCEAWVYLAGRAEEPGLEALDGVAGANPGLPDETGAWDRIWFKGGSEPGVLAASWYLTTDDGRSFVVAGSVVNETDAFDPTETILLFGAIRDLLATEVSQ